MFTQEPITEELVQEVARKIVREVHPRRIIAFGSIARGEQRPDSDLDLIVEMETDKPFYEGGIPITALIRDRKWAMDLLVIPAGRVRRTETVFGVVAFHC